MALIVSIETATNICSVAIHDDGKLLAHQSLHMAQSHSGLLVPTIQSLVKFCDLTVESLDAIAVSKGPGSYTGLRIGVSTAKGLCHALDVPLIAVNTLKAMARGMAHVAQGALLCPMIDARRMEVYYLLADEELNILESTAPKIIEPESFSNHLKDRRIIFFGNGSDKCKEVITHPNASFISQVVPDAVHVGALASEKFKKQEIEDLAYFDPFYLKEFRITKPKQK